MSEFNCGFETIGNATILCHDAGQSILATDPWIPLELNGGTSAYFGSWTLSHEIPEPQYQSIRDAKYVWFSHGHPDHLNPESLSLFREAKILLPDHFGKRIYDDLKRDGFDVTVLPDFKWTALSNRIRVLNISNHNQDAILLIDINGRLVLNLNDAFDTGWGRLVRKEIKKYPISFLASISGYGDADMFNFFDEQGNSNLPEYILKKPPIGKVMARRTDSFGAKYFIPFSSLHRFQRTDSAWANAHTPRLEDYAKGYDSKSSEILPAFIRYNCETDDLELIQPKATKPILYTPETFGDNWSDTLEANDCDKLSKYFSQIEKLGHVVDYIRLRVGGKEHTITLGKGNNRRGITLEVPRSSLMKAVEYEIFDDLLIGNFMKTYLHGEWKASRLNPDFSPFIAKYSDNGRAKSKEEVRAYFAHYRKRMPLDYLRAQFHNHAIRVITDRIPTNSPVLPLLKKTYYFLGRSSRKGKADRNRSGITNPL